MRTSRVATRVAAASIFILAAVQFSFSDASIVAETGSFPASSFDSTAINIEFDDLDSWAPINYITVPRGSIYEIQIENESSFLSASSQNGISAIVYTPEIDIRETPQMAFRWRVETFPEGATPTTKRRDDFALRIYVMFFDPDEEFSLSERIAGRLYKRLFGYDPPARILAYVWSEVPFDAPFQSLVNPRVVYFDAEVGGAGEWRLNTVNVADDYRRLFGMEPPYAVRVGVVSDSDSTGDESRGSIDFIRFAEE